MTGPSTMAHHKELHNRIAELEAEVERLREVHDTGYCREHDSYLGTDEPLGCLVPFAGKGRSA